jgi:hypothetical protein
MTQHVFNIGFNRSGTTSLTNALNILGIPSIHFSVDGSGWHKNNNKELEVVANINKEQGLNYFHTLDHIYQGFSDFNGEKYYKELYNQYPNSKFILTIRAPEDWIKSVITMERSQGKFQRDTKQEHNTFKRKVDRYFKKKNEIRDFFNDKPNTYLEMNICDGDGWKVLCNFLGRDIPSSPFPYVNKSESVK